MSPADGPRVDPFIVGALFEASLAAPARHARGAHFTAEPEIQRVIGPTIVRPWISRITAATTADDLLALHADLLHWRVLDPACGTGNFLYVAYSELVALERRLLARLRDEHTIVIAPSVGPHQCLGIDIDPEAVALARRVLTLAAERDGRPPADLTTTIIAADALFCAWPRADAIVGNPPFQAKNKARQFLGPATVARLRARYPDIPGRADYCVYWFRRAHDALAPGGRAGLVGTNTIRENDSRRGGLDHIVRTGAITEAVSSMPWPGDADVHVSIVNWIKQPDPDTPPVLYTRDLVRHELPRIHANLAPGPDTTAARELARNTTVKRCFQGQTPGHRGLLVDAALADEWRRDDPASAEVLFPYLIGDDLLDHPESAPSRLIIDFADRDLAAARRYARPFAHVEAHVLPTRERAAARESERNAEATRAAAGARRNHHHRQFLGRWWLPAFRREDMLAALARLPRYIACSRVTRRPIFEFIPATIRPGDAIQVFSFSDDYSFGVLQSDLHWLWFTARCSGLKVDPRYTSNTVFNSFPWPQDPSPEAVAAVSAAAERFRRQRRDLARARNSGLRPLYRSIADLDAHPLKSLHADLDAAVRRAYGMPRDADPLTFLVDLNHRLAG